MIMQQSFDRCGAVVSVVALAEEGETFLVNGQRQPYTPLQFRNQLYWAIGHELGHLIIQVQSGALWVAAGRHLNVADALMMSRNPVPDGLSVVVGHPEEIGRINLTNKAGVQ